MHEVGIMHNILDHAIERAKQEGAQHINHVHLRVGEESGVEQDSLALAFEVAKKGTIAENAQLEVESLPVLCYCNTNAPTANSLTAKSGRAKSLI
jgi:hydrogenase nickel incorporation protein HypA/HybF